MLYFSLHISWMTSLSDLGIKQKALSQSAHGIQRSLSLTLLSLAHSFFLSLTLSLSLSGLIGINVSPRSNFHELFSRNYDLTVRNQMVERFFFPPFLHVWTPNLAHNHWKSNDEALCLHPLDNDPVYILLVSTHTIIICTTIRGKQIKQRQ
jgi:hypothetical protein